VLESPRSGGATVASQPERGRRDGLVHCLRERQKETIVKGCSCWGQMFLQSQTPLRIYLRISGNVGVAIVLCQLNLCKIGRCCRSRLSKKIIAAASANNTTDSTALRFLKKRTSGVPFIGTPPANTPASLLSWLATTTGSYQRYGGNDICSRDFWSTTMAIV